MKNSAVKGNKAKIYGPFEDIYASEGDKCIFVEKNNLKGVVLNDGTEISCSYDEIGPCYDDTMFASKKGKWYLIDKSEKILRKFGQLKGKPCLSIFIIEKNGLYGAIDKDGKEVFPIEYTYIGLSLSRYFSSPHNILALCKEEDIQLSDGYGRIVTSRSYKTMGSSSLYCDLYHNTSVNDLICLNEDGKDGETPVVMFNCEKLIELNEYVLGQIVSRTDELFNRYNTFLMYKDGRAQLMSREGEVIIPFELGYTDFGYEPRPEEYLISAKKDGKWGYVSDCGSEKIKCMYDIAEPFELGHAIVGFMDENIRKYKFGIIDCHGIPKTPYAYNCIYKWGDKDGLLYVYALKTGTDCGKVYCSDGTEYDVIESIGSNDIEGFKMNDERYIFRNGQVVMETEKEFTPMTWKIECDRPLNWDITKENEKIGIKEEDTGIIIKPVFDDVKEITDRLLYANINDDYYVIYRRTLTRKQYFKNL